MTVSDSLFKKERCEWFASDSSKSLVKNEWFTKQYKYYKFIRQQGQEVMSHEVMRSLCHEVMSSAHYEDRHQEVMRPIGQESKWFSDIEVMRLWGHGALRSMGQEVMRSLGRRSWVHDAVRSWTYEVTRHKSSEIMRLSGHEPWGNLSMSLWDSGIGVMRQWENWVMI